MKKRSVLLLKEVTGEIENADGQIEPIDEKILEQLKPKNYHGRTGAEVTTLKRFESTCVLMKQHNVCNDPKLMTTLAFYQALETINEQAKKRN